MALSVDTGIFFFLAGGETEQTVLILHVQPHSNIHLSLWLSKCVGGNGPLSVIHDEEVLLVCHYQEVIACFYLCCLLLFWIPLTQNLARKHGVMTDGDGCECLRVCRDLCACKSRHTHIELNKESKGWKKRKSKNQVSLPIPSEVMQRNRNKELLFANYAARFSDHQIQSQLAAAKNKQSIAIFIPYKIQTPFGPLAAACCWRQQQQSQNR